MVGQLNDRVQASGRRLLSRAEALQQARATRRNMDTAIRALEDCHALLALYSRAAEQVCCVCCVCVLFECAVLSALCVVCVCVFCFFSFMW